MTDKKLETKVNEATKDKQEEIENLNWKWYSVLIPITGDKKLHKLHEYARREMLNGTKRSDKINRAITYCGEGAMYTGKYLVYAKIALSIVKHLS